jgi:hypothetical protein
VLLKQRKYMPITKRENDSLHDALDKLNEQKVLLVKEFLERKGHLTRYPIVFLEFAIQSTDLVNKVVECRPSATCPHFRFGSDVWRLDTRSGEMELMWCLPHIHQKATLQDLRRFTDEEHAMYDPITAESVHHLLEGRIQAYTKMYNETFPYKEIANQIHLETYGCPAGARARE